MSSYPPPGPPPGPPYGTPYGQPYLDPSAPFGRDPYTGQPMSDKSKVAAGLLQIFLGSLGVGRFYTGHTAIAVWMLVLTVVGWVTAIFLVGFLLIAAAGIWSFVDGVILLATDSTDSRGLKLR